MATRNKNILTVLEDRTLDYENKTALGIRTMYGWREFTYRGIGLLSRKLACYIINEINPQKGERLAILSESKPEYGACLFASVLSGTTTVPLDIKLTKYELKSILLNCEPTIMLVSQSFIETALELQKEVLSIKHIIVIDEIPYDKNFTSLYSLPNVYEASWRKRSSKSTAMIIYTSGTTGSPKGVEISFNNMLAQLEAVKPLKNHFVGDLENASALSILPMNHLFEMTVGFSAFLDWGLSVYYTQSLKPKDILQIMQEKKITFMIVVPAFLKLLKTGIESEINNSSIAKKTLFKVIFNVAKFIPSYRIKKVLFKSIHDKFGGQFRGCVSGGAPLDPAVGWFFETVGIRVFQGYGLSETSPVVSVNTDKRNVMESVGRPLQGFEAKLDPETHELMLKGPSVMKGYYKNPETTAEVLEPDGWLHTGDIGHIDEDGHIFITGRIKNMIVLSGGKKVFPEEVEAVLEKSPKFAEVCVFGKARSGGTKDGTEDIHVLIVPSQSLLDTGACDEVLDKIIREEVKELSLRLSSYKRPVNIHIQKEPLPRTTTRKVKRKEIALLV